MEAQAKDGVIAAGDLIPDRALTEHDRDAFDYEPIAARIAEIACEAEAPLNIAIFAPWGSGKSSLFSLIAQSLRERSAPMKLIRYDAWRYGGRALRRNFIAHTARELRLPEEDPDYQVYHRGLYEDQRRVTLNFARVMREARTGRVLPWAFLAVVLAGLGLAVSAGTLLIGAAISALLAIFGAVVEAGKVVVERSRPSEDEEFSERFGDLVAEVTERTPSGGLGSEIARRARLVWVGALARARVYEALVRWRWPQASPFPPSPACERLVFFIDELDRVRQPTWSRP